ncbi:MAG: endonuclease MutS2, partial [Ignavibacteriae bacterium]|nr:endonuclease MutS2 [Ignavibacteriota bacterium]
MKLEQVAQKLELERILQRVMRYAASEPGKEVLKALPFLTEVDVIKTELSRVTELKRLLEQEEGFPLEGIYQVIPSIQRAGVEGAVLLPRELHQVSSTLRSARVLRSFLDRRRETFPLLWQVAEPLYADKVLEYNIDQAIDDSASVRASASKELLSIRRTIAEKYEQLRKRLESILKGVSELGFSQEEIITTREGRMVIPVKSEHKNRVPGFIHSASSSGATVFIEPTETLELNNEIRSLQFQEQREIDRILRALTDQVGQSRKALLANSATLAQLDALHARARYSIEILGVQPEVVFQGALKLVQARHPILMMSHGHVGTVPLDFELGDRYHTVIISGPNAGGKSVAMKCVGVVILMVQHGLHIPASDQSVVRVFRKLFVDIGDEQSIENDLSTFSSHLSNLKIIALGADEDSLVLIDEIGTGTDPAEGGAIAAALLDSLTRRKAFTIATTHHSALKVFASETEGVENGAMEFDQETLTPTYRYKSGVPGSSYALEMAARLGFSEELLQKSRERLGFQHVKLDKLIAELESSAQRYKRD